MITEIGFAHRFAARVFPYRFVWSKNGRSSLARFEEAQRGRFAY